MPTRPAATAYGLRYLNWHEIQSGDAVEVTDVGGSDPPSGGQGSGSDEPVMGSDFDAGRGKARPESGVDPRNEQVEGKCRERGEDGLHKCFALSAMLIRGTMHTVQELGGRDGGDAHLLSLAQPSFKTLCHRLHGPRDGEPTHGALELDEDRRV
jgi:hypothetical protein